jgi:hypothetical protein
VSARQNDFTGLPTPTFFNVFEINWVFNRGHSIRVLLTTQHQLFANTVWVLIFQVSDDFVPQLTSLT